MKKNKKFGTQEKKIKDKQSFTLLASQKIHCHSNKKHRK